MTVPAMGLLRQPAKSALYYSKILYWHYLRSASSQLNDFQQRLEQECEKTKELLKKLKEDNDSEIRHINAQHEAVQLSVFLFNQNSS